MTSTQEKSASMLRVVIVGGGPVGLAIATGFAKEGHKVTVLERHPGLQTRGGPVQIHRAAIKVYQYLGLDSRLEVHSQAARNIWWSVEDTEKPLDVRQVAEGGMRITDRILAQKFSYKGALAAGAAVLFNKTVAHLDDTKEYPSVSTTDGTEYIADLIIASDGIKSKMREMLFSAQAIPLRDVVFSSRIPRESVLADPRAAKLTANGGGGNFTLGPGKFNIVGIAAESPLPTAIIFSTVRDYGPPPSDSSVSWVTPGDVEELRGLFAGFPEQDRACLEYATETQIWRLGVAPEVPSWRGKSGRVVLLGDAAHAMVPYAGQGLSQGIESVGALCRLLRFARAHSPTQDIPELMERFEAIRRPRADRMARVSWENRVLFTLPAGKEQEERDAEMRKSDLEAVNWDAVESDMNAQYFSAEFAKWTRSYNFCTEVEQYMEKHPLRSI